MSKRGNGEGNIRQRSDGRWEARVSYADGKRKSFFGRTRTEVSRKMSGALKDQIDGLPPPSGRHTVGQVLQEWLASVKPSVRPRTWVRYEEYVRLHAVPHVGRIAAAQLTPQRLQRLYVDLLEAELSPSTVAHLHAVLHSAFEQATRWGIVARNVVALATPPRLQRKEMVTLSQEEARLLLEAAAGDRFEALYVLAVSTGMRQGELLGIRWRDIDLEGALLQVRSNLQRTPAGFVWSEPKTARSRRQVLLTDKAIAALKRHRLRLTEDRLKMGSAWEDLDLVFPNEIGRPVEASNLIRRSFFPLLGRAGLPRIRFHDLRHTAATLLLAQGMHPKVVADMLGHSQIAVTLDLYSHTTPAMHRQAAIAMDAILGA